MARSLKTLNAMRNGFLTAAAETVAHEMSRQLIPLLNGYIDPGEICFNAAYGYWAHNHQDCQRIVGHFKVVGSPISYSFGTWDYTLSQLARSGLYIIDERDNRYADNDFMLMKGKKPTCM